MNAAIDVAAASATASATSVYTSIVNATLARPRADLLAEVAGIFEGTSEGELDEPLARQAAQLCRLAGADAALIPAWIAEGKRRVEAARKPPHGGRRLQQRPHFSCGGYTGLVTGRAGEAGDASCPRQSAGDSSLAGLLT
jgi:hypothetical protein